MSGEILKEYLEDILEEVPFLIRTYLALGKFYGVRIMSDCIIDGMKVIQKMENNNNLDALDIEMADIIAKMMKDIQVANENDKDLTEHPESLDALIRQKSAAEGYINDVKKMKEERGLLE